ncbi:MAG TPA: hypothetical protein PKZ32_11415 [Candidatus Melainabacteria bacterium]|nr:hypothetical protein [Candidatus Melainabacteria bacterium]
MPPITNQPSRFVDESQRDNRHDSSNGLDENNPLTSESTADQQRSSNDKSGSDSDHSPSGNAESSTVSESKREETAHAGEAGGLNAFDLLSAAAKYIIPKGNDKGKGDAGVDGMPSGDEILPLSNLSKMTPEQKAVSGYRNAESHEDFYMKMKGPYEQKTFDEASLRKPKDASVNLNDKGQITDFTTAPVPGKGEGLSYKNFKYDDAGAVKSFETPWGTTISRIGEADKNGYGKWQQTNKQGQLVNYQGADASSWFGKSVVDEKGIHILVASGGAKQWNMYSRSLDGTYTETNPDVAGGVLKGFETTTTLADNTKISSKSHFEKGEIVRDSAVDLFGEKGEKNLVELDESKKNGKLISSDELKKREALASVMDFDKNQLFSNVNSMSLNRRGNNIDFSVDLDHAMDTPPPNVRVYGVGGFKRASAVPISSQINDPRGTIITHPENPGQVDVVNMQGFTGKSQAYGPLGRPRGQHDGSTNSMTLYSDRNGNGHVVARSDQATVDLTARHMNGGLFGDMLANPAKKQAFTDGLAKLRDNLDSLEFRKDSKGALHGSFDPRMSEIPLNKKLDDPAMKMLGMEATKLYFGDGKLKFDIQNLPNGKELSFQKGELTVGVRGNLMPETKWSVSKVVTTKDAQGRPHVEVEFYGFDGRQKLF